MRAISSFVLVAAFASCSALDNFGKFTVAGADMAGGGCTPGCDCIAADPALGVPAHCAITPLNAINCSGIPRAASTVTLSAGAYSLDSGASPPVLSDPSGKTVMTGVISGGFGALFCIGSLVADQGTRIAITGNRPVAIVADSLVRMTNSSWALAGEYASDENGAHGVAGGSDGGGSGNSGSGAGGGRAGIGAPGTGGGGGGAAATGAPGGSAGTNPVTQGGAGSGMPIFGFGGGGGGKGTTNGGGGGGGAGALQLTASWAIELDSVTFNATGGGGGGGFPAGTAGGPAGGGGGGGGGGTVTLDSPTVMINGGCISVIGGPGGAGAAAIRGGDAHATQLCGFIGSAGVAPPMGGGGGVPGGPYPGGNGTGLGGGGGGLGGYGRVTLRSHNPPPLNMPPGVFPIQAYSPMTLP